MRFTSQAPLSASSSNSARMNSSAISLALRSADGLVMIGRLRESAPAGYYHGIERGIQTFELLLALTCKVRRSSGVSPDIFYRRILLWRGACRQPCLAGCHQ